MSCDQSVLLDYLDGAMGPRAAEQFEGHLLACDECWRAVASDRAGRDVIRAARESAPSTLADRVQLAVSLSVHPSPPRRTWRVAALAAVAVLVVGVSTSVIPRDRAAEPDLIAVATAFAATPGAGTPRVNDASVEISRTSIDGTPVVVARSDRPFPMPDGAEPIDGVADAWAVKHGGLTIVCVNQPHPRLIVGPLDAGRLIDATS